MKGVEIKITLNFSALKIGSLIDDLARRNYVPFRYFSPYEYLVISLPDTPHVPIPTRPLTLSGDAKMLFGLMVPAFFVFFVVKFNHLFLSCSRSSSNVLKRCCFFAFFRFKYSLLFGRCRLQNEKCVLVSSKIFFCFHLETKFLLFKP